jgi:lysine-2,3-aminomutase-related protein
MNAAPKTLRTLSDLAQSGLAPADKRAALERVAAQYAVAITPALAELIERADPNDPIARQFVPDAAELDVRPEEMADPIGDNAHSPVEGIVHRYPDRALLKLTSVCAVYCRFCFRRETIGPGAKPLTGAALERALGYIAAHDQIWEVILTGGDPLVLSARRMKQVVARLAAIAHVKVIRVHTRVPVADPARITPELVRALKIRGKATYVVLHVNHARELTELARTACARLVDAGIPLLSQSVLLQRRPAGARGADARIGRVPDQAVLPASRRSRARHGASAYRHRARPSADAGAARPAVRPLPAELRARHSRRARQIADRPELSFARPGRTLSDRGLQRANALLSAAVASGRHRSAQATRTRCRKSSTKRLNFSAASADRSDARCTSPAAVVVRPTTVASSSAMPDM